MKSPTPLRGAKWPNIMFGPHVTLGGARIHSADRPFLCRLELDTYLTEEEANRLRQDLSKQDLRSAVRTVTSARHLQGLDPQDEAVTACMKQLSKPPTPPPNDAFSIRVEALVDYGAGAVATATVKFALDVYLEDLPTELTEDALEEAVEDALSNSDEAKRIFAAFKAAFPKPQTTFAALTVGP